MSGIICIYHGNCADGFGAAWAVRNALGSDIEFYPGVYQQDPPDVTNKKVIMVDFSYKKAVIEEMAETAQSILIIDHHATAKDDLAEFPEPPLDTAGEYSGWLPNDGVYCNFDMTQSGAILAWIYFNPFLPAPKLLMHIQDRDLWKFELEGTREIQANVFSYPYDFEAWDNLMAMDTDLLKSDGAAIERKHFKDIREFIEAAAYRKEIGGFDVPVLNAPYFWSSDAGHIMGQGEPFAACYWDTADGTVWSLRSSEEGEDVSKIALQFGGGGHKHAAGFTIGLYDKSL